MQTTTLSPYRSHKDVHPREPLGEPNFYSERNPKENIVVVPEQNKLDAR
jgi:hypothetical protein